MASALLYAYATSLKKYILIAPLIRSLLAGLAILAVGLYDLWPAITNQNRATITTFFLIIVDYAIFISLLNFVRELVVNQRNIDGDHKNENKTLPLVLGKDRTNKIIFALTLLPLAGVCYYISQYLYMHTASLLYAIILLIIPLFYVSVKVLGPKHTTDYLQRTILLKLGMLFSVRAIGLSHLLRLYCPYEHGLKIATLFYPQAPAGGNRFDATYDCLCTCDSFGCTNPIRRA